MHSGQHPAVKIQNSGFSFERRSMALGLDWRKASGFTAQDRMCDMRYDEIWAFDVPTSAFRHLRRFSGFLPELWWCRLQN